MFFNGESAIQIAPSGCGGAAGTATTIAGRKDLRLGFPPVPSHLASGRRVQFEGSSQFSRIALYQRPSLGQKVSRGRVVPAFGATALRATSSLPKSGRVSDHRDCHFSPSRSGSGLHHLVFGQVGRICPLPEEVGDFESGNHSTHPASSWSTVSHRSDLVPEHRSGFRGKKTP